MPPISDRCPRCQSTLQATNGRSAKWVCPTCKARYRRSRSRSAAASGEDAAPLVRSRSSWLPLLTIPVVGLLVAVVILLIDNVRLRSNPKPVAVAASETDPPSEPEGPPSSRLPTLPDDRTVPAPPPKPPAPQDHPPAKKDPPRRDPAPPREPLPLPPPPPKPATPESTLEAPPQPKPPDKPMTSGHMRLDKFGNPSGNHQGLARDGEFKGKRLLVWCSALPEDMPNSFNDTNPLWKTLEAKGFTVERKLGRFRPKWLKAADQLWVFSTSKERGSPNLKEADLNAVEKFVAAGKGLYLLADNEPYTTEAEALTRRLFKVGVSGNYDADKIAYVLRPSLTPKDIRRFKGNYGVRDHPLLTGVNFLYEGVTISHIAPSDKLEAALRASDHKILIAVSKVPGQRLVIDCGYTRYCYEQTEDLQLITRTAGTLRLAENVAAYLAGKDR